MTYKYRMTMEERRGAQRVLEQTAVRYGMTTQEVQSLGKDIKYNEVKWYYWASLLFDVGLTVTWAGRVAKRDHTTLIHSLRRMGEELYGLPYKSTLAEIGEVWKAHNLAWREAA